MKKIILILLCFITSLMLSGCIFNNSNSNEESEYATNSDLELTIKRDNDSLSFEIELTNINIESVKIDKWFNLDINFLDVYIKGPDNESLNIFYGESNRPNEIMILEPGDHLSLKLPLDELEITYNVLVNDEKNHEELWDWSTSGQYSIYTVYNGAIGGEVQSNHLQFEITT